MFRYHHTAISVSNIEKSIDFYSRMGFKEVLLWQSENKDLIIANLKLNDFYLELFCYTDFQASTVNSELNNDLKHIGVRHFALQVDSVDKAKVFFEKNSIASNIKVNLGRTGLKYFFITDPDKIFVEIVEDNRMLE
ncbi:MAG: VOC family protein [Bacteroidota bacterium]